MLLPLLYSIVAFYSVFFEAEEINALKQKAEQCYQKHLYLEAIKAYTTLEQQYHLKDSEILYNHASACYKSLQYQSAYQLYKQLSNNTDKELASQAFNQMGIIACKTGKVKQGREHFKDALRKNASNQQALQNLMWSFTLFEAPQNKKGNKNNTAQLKQSSSEQSSENTNADLLKSDKQKTPSMSMEKARLLLETMKKSEKQFLQQRSSSTQKQQENGW
jgi:hypothetical protein